MSPHDTIEQQVVRLSLSDIYHQIHKAVDKEMKYDFAHAMLKRTFISPIGDIKWSLWNVLQFTGLQHEPA